MTLNVPSWSTSTIELYHNCPYRYYRQRVKKDVQDKPNEYAEFGTYLHQRMEDRLREGRPLPQDLLAQCPKLEDYAQEVEALPGDRMLEHQMAINRELRPTGWFAKDAWGRAIADVLVLNNDEAWVIDWKTGKPKDNRLQSHILAFVTLCTFPAVQVLHTSFVYVKHGVKKEESYRRADDMVFLADTISDQLADISFSFANDGWGKKPSGLCRWCPVEECEHHE